MSGENRDDIQVALSKITNATEDMVQSFSGVMSGLVQPMTEQFTRFRLSDLEEKVSNLTKELARMQAKIINLERGLNK